MIHSSEFGGRGEEEARLGRSWVNCERQGKGRGGVGFDPGGARERVERGRGWEVED